MLNDFQTRQEFCENLSLYLMCRATYKLEFLKSYELLKEVMRHCYMLGANIKFSCINQCKRRLVITKDFSEF